MLTDATHAVDARHLSDAVLAIDTESRIVAANAAAGAAFGCEPRALVGERVHAWAVAEDRAGLTPLLDAARRGRVAEGTLRFGGAAGGAAHRFVVLALPAGGGAGLRHGNIVTLVLHDVTPLDRLAEEGHRRAHLERTPGQFVLTLDSAGMIEHALGLDTVLGHAPRAWIGRHVGGLLEAGARADELLTVIWRELAAVGRWTSIEQCVRSDGTSVAAQLFATTRVDFVTRAPAGCYLSGLAASPVGEAPAIPDLMVQPAPVLMTSASPGRARRSDTPLSVPLVAPGSGTTVHPARRSSRETRLVLVADDEAPMRALVRTQLERGGYGVAEVTSGRDALRLLREGVSPRFLVVDLRMPDGSGGWLVSQIGYEFPKLIARTVVITGDAGSAAAAHVAARWGCPVVPKPFDGFELLDTLAELGSGAADVA